MLLFGWAHDDSCCFASWIGPFHWQPMMEYLHSVGRSSHPLRSWWSNDDLGNSWLQNYEIESKRLVKRRAKFNWLLDRTEVHRIREPNQSRFFQFSASLLIKNPIEFAIIVKGKFRWNYLTFAGQLADSLLDRQVARCIVLWNFNATVGARGDLITQTTISQQVREATGAHQMTELTLKRLEMKENKKTREEEFVSQGHER